MKTAFPNVRFQKLALCWQKRVDRRPKLRQKDAFSSRNVLVWINYCTFPSQRQLHEHLQLWIVLQTSKWQFRFTAKIAPRTKREKKSVEKLTDYVYLLKTAYQSIIKPVSAPSPISGANDPCNVSAFPTDVFPLRATLFGMRCAPRHGWPFYEDSKSFREEHDLCMKCSGKTRTTAWVSG